jgi:hypothetical protein
MKPICAVMLVFLFLTAGCDDRRLAHAFARQIEALDRKVEAALKPLDDALVGIAISLNPDSVQSLDAARTAALAQVKAIRSEFHATVESHPNLQFGKEMYDAFVKFLVVNIRLLEVDLLDITDLMFRSMANPTESRHRRAIPIKLKDFADQTSRATSDVNAMLRDFGAAHGMKVYGN